MEDTDTGAGGQLRRTAVNLSVEIEAASCSPDADAVSSPSSSARGKLLLRLPSMSSGARVSPTPTPTACSTLDPRSPSIPRTPLSTKGSDVDRPDDEASTSKEPADPRSPGMERTPVPSVLDDADNITKLSGRLMPVDSLQLLKEARSQKLLGTSAAAGGWSKLREYTRESSDLQRDITRNKTLLGLSVQEMMARMKTAAIKARTQSRFVIPETSKLRIRWDMCQFFVLVYVALSVPIRIGFSVEAEGILYSIELLIELYFWVDIVFNFFTSYVDDDRVVVTELKKIRARYLSTWFLVDIISVTPLDLVLRIMAGRMPCSFFIEGCSGTVKSAGSSGQFVKVFKMLRLIRLVKLLRLMRLDRLYERYKDELFFFLRMLTVMRLVIMLMYLGHLFGCLFYYFSHDYFRTGAERALARDGLLFTWLDQEDQETLTEKYVASVYWSFTTMTTVGYGDISAKTVAERVFAIVGMLMGGFVLSAIISKLVLVVEEADLGKKTMKKKLLMVEEWVKDLHLPKDYRVRVLNHFRNQAHRPYESQRLLMMLPFDLREYVCSHQYGDILDEVPFFADGGNVFRTEIATLFTERLVLSGCRVYEMGEVGLELFILREGAVDVLDPSIPAGASVLGRGAYFGEGILLGDVCRQESVVVRTNAQMLVIEGVALQPIMDRFPATLQMIRAVYLKRRSVLKCNSRRELASLDGDHTKIEAKGEERRRSGDGAAFPSMFSSEESPSPRSMRRVSFDDDMKLAGPSSAAASVRELLRRQTKVEKSVERLETHIGEQLRGIQAALAGIEARLGALQA